MGKIIKHSVIENVPFWILSGVALIIGIIAFFLPPMGDIKPNALKFIGWIYAFTALWTVFAAMMRGIDARVQHGKTSLTVGNLDGKETTQKEPADDETEYDFESEEIS